MRETVDRPLFRRAQREENREEEGDLAPTRYNPPYHFIQQLAAIRKGGEPGDRAERVSGSEREEKLQSERDRDSGGRAQGGTSGERKQIEVEQRREQEREERREDAKKSGERGGEGRGKGPRLKSTLSDEEEEDGVRSKGGTQTSPTPIMDEDNSVTGGDLPTKNLFGILCENESEGERDERENRTATTSSTGELTVKIGEAVVEIVVTVVVEAEVEVVVVVVVVVVIIVALAVVVVTVVVTVAVVVVVAEIVIVAAVVIVIITAIRIARKKRKEEASGKKQRREKR